VGEDPPGGREVTDARRGESERGQGRHRNRPGPAFPLEVAQPPVRLVRFSQRVVLVSESASVVEKREASLHFVAVEDTVGVREGDDRVDVVQVEFIEAQVGVAAAAGDLDPLA
jgi:hypothetical protein